MEISKFQGEYRFLSNFWFATVEFDGLIYKSVEHAYQAAKTLDQDIRLKIRDLNSPGDAKRFAKTFKLRSDWEQVKLEIMEDLVRQKFTNHSYLCKRLLGTEGFELIEGNTWNDTFWGVCNGKGENNLGKILMKVRKEIKQHRKLRLKDGDI